jgi:hypothetical protein
VFATWLTLRGDLAPPTLLWGNDTLGATTKDSGHHASDGNGEEDLANEFHRFSFGMLAKVIYCPC